MAETKKYDALALLSGGLDSILAMRTVMDQGLSVLGLHYVTSFFGKEQELDHWRDSYGIESVAVDIRQAYADMLLAPSQGYGKWLNPCIDCKITMLTHAVGLLPAYGAQFLISGEVVGQRPMSQREDTLNLITKRAGVRDVLLRPLCAKHQPVTPMEESGLVDRDRLHGWSGRGRKPQMSLAEHYGFSEVPTPAGGCCLTEAQGAARFVRLLSHKPAPTPGDFTLARFGRQVWAGTHWLSFGRTAADNEKLAECAEPGDYLFKLQDFPGPLAVARPVDGEWAPEAVADAAGLIASYSGKARKHFEATGDKIKVRVIKGGRSEIVEVIPTRDTRFDWVEPQPGIVSQWKKDRAKTDVVPGRSLK